MRKKKVVHKISKQNWLRKLSSSVSLAYSKIFSKKSKPSNHDQITDHNWWEWV